jgi:hypothetical protein
MLADLKAIADGFRGSKGQCSLTRDQADFLKLKPADGSTPALGSGSVMVNCEDLCEAVQSAEAKAAADIAKKADPAKK